ncbi:hypothetical protein [Parafrankia sp. BMG5.11]|uniref:hypothetical protein n=1 Tax=Parafrankia sp. BMG5.11 TaxID=222540 RepID=UPI00103DC00C|nr:hypothetical protein [Parafrankia sp. BMG5.11]TCJ32286.1 hypothetical protein E0504_43690 [Parafrankia sp. BMG5.11]
MQMFEDEFIGGTIYSAVAPVTSAWLSRVAAVLDGAGQWRPTRGGGRDPGRTKVSSTTAAIVPWFESWKTKRDGMWFFGDEANDITGRIDAFALESAPAHRPVLQQIEFNAQESLFSDQDACERYATIFAALCDAADAFVGWAAHTPMLRQSVQHLLRRRELRGGPPMSVAAGAHQLEYVLPDVRWLNYFGPAFIEGAGDGLNDVGFRCERTTNGGALVWATPNPFVLEHNATQFEDYAWKRSFYEFFDAAFVRSDADGGALGEHVPSLVQHRRHLTRP